VRSRGAGHTDCLAGRATRYPHRDPACPRHRASGILELESPPLHSVADTIQQLAPRLPLALVEPAAASRLRTVAASLPAPLTNWIYLECRLRRDAPRVDLTVRVDQGGREILAGRNPVVAIDDTLHVHPVWRGVRALAREWSTRSSPLYGAIERVWLEFDVHEDSTPPGRIGMPAPGVFIEFAREAYAQHRREERFRVAIASLQHLLPEGLLPEMSRNLRRCWELLPAGVSIPYIGLFPARESRAVRVCVAGLGDADMMAYLRAVRWPGSHRGLASAMEGVILPARAPRPRMAIVNLDVGQVLGSGVGIELLLSHAAQLHGGVLETAFLNHLVERRFCSAPKCDALLGWPATSLQTMPHELWRSRVSRRVNHVKLSLADDGVLEVKAYLSASHTFQPARSPSHGASIRMQHSTR
jgi:hypothetical protein